MRFAFCFGLWCLGNLAVSSGLAQPAINGQRVLERTVATRSLMQGPKYVPLTSKSAVPARLRQAVTLQADGWPLARALDEIARQLGLPLIYDTLVTDFRRPITVKLTGVSGAQAILSVLHDTGLQMEVMEDGSASRIRRLAGTQAEPGETGTIAGRVTDTTGHALAGVEVLLSSTRWHAATDTAGRYRLTDIDSGTYTLLVRHFGYGKFSRAVTVRDGGTDTIDIVLVPVAARLDELVTTATGRQRRVELANDITTLNADSIVRNEPITSVTDILETRVPGLSVQHTSGAPGDPSRLRLRGAGSPLRSNDPIVIVDGIRIYAEQSALRSRNLGSNQNISDRASGDGSFYAKPSPLDNIDPNSIATIEVFKGPSAATLYGQDAANGVIVVTTKKGQAGPPHWTARAEHGRSHMEGDYPDLLIRWGHTLNSNTPIACPAGNQTYLGVATSGFACEPDSLTNFQMLNDPSLTILDKGQRTAASLGVSGGVAALTYSLTGSYQYETGLPRLPAYEIDRYQAAIGSSPPDWMLRPQHLQQWGVTSQIGARIGSKADVMLSTQLSRTVQQRSSLEQQLATLMSTYLDQASGIYYQQTSTTNLALTTASNELFQSYFERATAAATTFTPGLNFTWRPQTWLTLKSDVGVSVVQEADQIFRPRGAFIISNAGGTDPVANDSNGYVYYGHGNSLVSTFKVQGNARAPMGRGFQFQFDMGAEYTGTSTHDLSVQTRNLPLGTSLVGTIINPGGVQPRTRDDATFGWYMQPAITNSRFWINLGLRLDGGSAYGGNVTMPKLPKLGFSYLLSDESFYPFKNIIPTFRLRVAYGRAGRQPGVTDRLRLYSAPSSSWVNGVLVPTVLLQTVGNNDIRPEQTTELEGGFDADLLDNRLSVTVSGYRKTTDDALLNTPVAPSVYGDLVKTVRNIGVVRNTGLDLTVDGQLIRSGPVTLGTRLSVSRKRNAVVELGPGVEPFYTQGTSTSGQRVAAGYPLFGRWAKPILGYADGNGNGVIDQSEILVGDTAVYVGAAEPNYEADIATTLSLWRGAVSVSTTFQYQDGFSQLNDVAKDLVAFSHGWNDPTTSEAEQVATSTVTDYNWVQTVNTFRFYSLAMTYRVPQTAARRLGAQSLSIAVQATNLGLWTGYRGLDPNVNAFGTGNSVTDTGVLPEPRTWQVRVSATY